MSAGFYLDHIKKCVAFVYDLSGEPLGTGFFASIELEGENLCRIFCNG